jgi:hypothetical protein
MDRLTYWLIKPFFLAAYTTIKRSVFIGNLVGSFAQACPHQQDGIYWHVAEWDLARVRCLIKKFDFSIIAQDGRCVSEV